MAINKSAKAEVMTYVVVAVLIGLALYFFNVGGFKNIVSSWSTPSVPSGGGSGAGTGGLPLNMVDCPTDGTTTYTLNVQDELTSTATNVDSEYFIFNGNKLIKEGTTGSDGTVDVDVACGKDYKLLLLNTTAGTGSYAKFVDLQARISSDTVNAKITRFGTGKVVGIENPSDPAGNANVSLVAGGSKNFLIKIVANYTERGFNKPIIMCQANISSIKLITLAKFSDGTDPVVVTTLPKRITATAGYAYYAWAYPKMLSPASGVISSSGTITVLSSVTPSEADSMSCKLIDQATWKVSNYKTTSSIDEGFKEGPENSETLADVGGSDSPASSYYFVSAGGY